MSRIHQSFTNSFKTWDKGRQKVSNLLLQKRNIKEISFWEFYNIKYNVQFLPCLKI